MPDLLLHIGHNKTGSSWIQSTLRASVEALQDAGVIYPLRGEDPQSTKVTTGNGAGLLGSAALLGRALRQAEPGKSLLFSSELLFMEFARNTDLQKLPKAARAAGFDRVRILLFIRDPVDHAASVWHQDVKRHGLTSGLDARYLEGYETPIFVERLLKDIADLDHAEIVVHNYSRNPDRLLPHLAEFLRVDREILTTPATTRVNRSLSPAETALQVELNRALGPRARLLSNRLCNRLPEVSARLTLPSEEDQRQLVDRLRPHLEQVNGIVAPECRYHFEIMAPSADHHPSTDEHSFSAAQLRVIADAIAELVDRAKSPSRLRQLLASVRRRLRTR